jgi:hypothetical protein
MKLLIINEKNGINTRWIFFVPMAIVGSLFVRHAFKVENSDEVSFFSKTIMELVKSIAGGATFVGLGTLIAPRPRAFASILLCALHVGFSVLLVFAESMGAWGIANVVASNAGVIGMWYFLKSKFG